MDKELALRTFGYLIGHYKTHDETIINSQEIEAIEFMLKDNDKLEQQCKKQKEVIDKVNKCIKDFLCSEEFIGVDGISIANNYENILDILNEVLE